MANIDTTIAIRAITLALSKSISIVASSTKLSYVEQ